MKKFVVLLSLSLLLISMIHSEESKIDFRIVSRKLTIGIREIIESSSGSLYSVDKSELAGLFEPSVNVWGGLEYGFGTMVFAKKTPISSTHEALELHRRIYQELLPKLNAMRSLRPYLAEFPLTPNSFSLDICFKPKGKAHSPLPYFESLLIHYIPYEPKIQLSLVQYYKRDESVHYPFQEVFRMPLEQVSGLTPFFQSKVERKPCQKNPWLLANYFPTTDHISVQIVYQFVPKFCSQNGLHLISWGAVGNHHHHESAFGLALAGTHKLLLEDARKFATRCALAFLQHIQESQDAKLHVVNWKKLMKRPDLQDPLNVTDFALRLSFWDENIDRRENPYIAEIRMNKGKLEYFTSDEGQRLVPIFEESFDEAMLTEPVAEVKNNTLIN